MHRHSPEGVFAGFSLIKRSDTVLSDHKIEGDFVNGTLSVVGRIRLARGKCKSFDGASKQQYSLLNPFLIDVLGR